MPTIDTPAPEKAGSAASPFAAERPPLGRYLRATVVIVLIWIGVAWLLSGRYIDAQTKQVLTEAQQKINQDMTDIATGLERNLVIFHGIPAIVGRSDSVHQALSTQIPLATTLLQAPAERRPHWLALPALARLNASLAASVKDIRALSVIWVINPVGDCIASSNSQAKESFVGVNYADRAYFQAAREGRQGRQFAVGRATKIPGLFFRHQSLSMTVFSASSPERSICRIWHRGLIRQTPSSLTIMA